MVYHQHRGSGGGWEVSMEMLEKYIYIYERPQLWIQSIVCIVNKPSQLLINKKQTKIQINKQLGIGQTKAIVGGKTEK